MNMKKRLRFWYNENLNFYEKMAQLFPTEKIWRKAIEDTKKALEELGE